MDIRHAYDEWSKGYDTSENLTRDLDKTVIGKVLSGSSYQKILELGCGTGKNTGFLSQIGEVVHAVDFSEGMINEAKLKVGSGNVVFSVFNITRKWLFENNIYDLVTCNLILEHIDNLNFIFSEVSRVLKNNGKFFVSEFHPFQQYLGKKPRYNKEGKRIEIDSFVHNISDFIHSAKINGLYFSDFKEWRIDEEKNKPPRIVSFMFEKNE